MAGKKELFQKAMNQGHSAAWDQEWEKAAHWYRAALEEFPDHPQALSSLGLALFEMQDYLTALQCYQKAASIAPNDPVPQEKIARIYERLGRLNEAITASLQAAEMHLKARSADKAIDNWQRALSIQPENLAVRNKLAAVFERMGRKEEAIAEYIATASLFQRAGDLARASRTIEQAQRLMPDNQEVRLALSMLRSGQTLPRPARPKRDTGPVQIPQAKDTDDDGESQPDPVEASRQKAMVELAGMLFDQADENSGSARAVLLKTGPLGQGRGLNALTRGIGGGASGSGDRTRIILHLGQAIDSQTQGDRAQAVVELEHAVKLGLNQPAAFYDLGLLLKDDDPDRAMRYLQQSIKHPDYDLASTLLVAGVYEKGQQWQQAARTYIQSLALADAQCVPAEQADELLAQYDALTDGQNGEDTAAMETICRTVSSHLLRPNWRAALQKARVQLPPPPADGPPLPVAEIVLETRASGVVEAMEQVRQLAEKGMLRSASEEAFYALQFAPTYLPLHILIAELLIQDGHTHEAVRKFMIVADLYTARGENSRALRMLKRVSQLMPTDLAIRQRIIDLLVSQAKVEEALQEYCNLADLYYRLAELDKARQIYLEALNVAQKSKENRGWGVNILLKVADIDLQRLNLRQALRSYEHIRTIQPENAMVRSQLVTLNFRLGQDEAAMKELDNYLAYLENNGQRAQAIVFVNDLLVDQSARNDLRRRMADLYIRNNQVPEAVAQLDSAADILLSAGKHLEAINLLETIISLNPPNAGDYKSALENLRREMLRK